MEHRLMPSRSGAGPAVIAAVALAMVSLAVAGSQPALAGPRSCEARSTLADGEATRLLAAAVAAAKNLLGVDHAARAIIESEPILDWRVLSDVFAVRHRDQQPARATPALRPHLIDLPPPVC
jgi:hypothetical protein